MKEMEHIKPSGTFDLVTPVPDGYEVDADGSTILAVDRSGAKPPLYFSFFERARGWHPCPNGTCFAWGETKPVDSDFNHLNRLL